MNLDFSQSMNHVAYGGLIIIYQGRDLGPHNDENCVPYVAHPPPSIQPWQEKEDITQRNEVVLQC
jgi:hypothetical protein